MLIDYSLIVIKFFATAGMPVLIYAGTGHKKRGLQAPCWIHPRAQGYFFSCILMVLSVALP